LVPEHTEVTVKTPAYFTIRAIVPPESGLIVPRFGRLAPCPPCALRIARSAMNGTLPIETGSRPPCAYLATENFTLINDLRYLTEKTSV
jgi:hypothetical protein